MHFLRFGSSIPGSYWGCCAVDIIQDFNKDPSEKASIEIVTGDSGTSCLVGREKAFLGKTYEEIFRQRLRIGTFHTGQMQNHAFLAVITRNQISTAVGKRWLKILAEEGFEFVRAIDNSVYGAGHPNYLFGLFRNISNRIGNVFDPPEAWTKETVGKTEPCVTARDLHDQIVKEQKKHWAKGESPVFLTEAQLRKENIPVILAGQRTKYLQQTVEERERVKKVDKNFEKQVSLKAAPPSVPVSDMTFPV